MMPEIEKTQENRLTIRVWLPKNRGTGHVSLETYSGVGNKTHDPGIYVSLYPVNSSKINCSFFVTKRLPYHIRQDSYRDHDPTGDLNPDVVYNLYTFNIERINEEFIKLNSGALKAWSLTNDPSQGIFSCAGLVLYLLKIGDTRELMRECDVSRRYIADYDNLITVRTVRNIAKYAVPSLVTGTLIFFTLRSIQVYGWHAANNVLKIYLDPSIRIKQANRFAGRYAHAIGYSTFFIGLGGAGLNYCISAREYRIINSMITPEELTILADQLCQAEKDNFALLETEGSEGFEDKPIRVDAPVQKHLCTLL